MSVFTISIPSFPILSSIRSKGISFLPFYWEYPFNILSDLSIPKTSGVLILIDLSANGREIKSPTIRHASTQSLSALWVGKVHMTASGQWVVSGSDMRCPLAEARKTRCAIFHALSYLTLVICVIPDMESISARGPWYLWSRTSTFSDPQHSYSVNEK